MFKNLDKNTLVIMGGIALFVSLAVVKANEKMVAKKTEPAKAA